MGRFARCCYSFRVLKLRVHVKNRSITRHLIIQVFFFVSCELRKTNKQVFAQMGYESEIESD